MVLFWLAFENNLQVRFAWGGDISGQNVCRDESEGFPVMEVLNSVPGKDFFLNVGDAIYGKLSSIALEQQLLRLVKPSFVVLTSSQYELDKALSESDAFQFLQTVDPCCGREDTPLPPKA